MSMMRIRSLTIPLVIVFGAAATLWGFSQMSWPTASPFAWDPLRRDSTFMVVSAVVVVAISAWLKVNRLAAGSVVACCIAILTGSTWPLLVTIWFAFASYILGRAILALLKIDKEKLPNITAALIGAGAYGTAVGLAAHFPINYPGLDGLALATPVVLGWCSVCATVRSFGQS